MRQNYSEGNEGRLNYIYEQIIKPIFFFYHEPLEYIDQRIYKSLSYYLALWVENLYQKTFPEIYTVCDNLAQNFKKTNPITLSCPNNSDFQYQQLVYNTTKILRPSYQKSRNSELSIHLQTDIPNIKKIEQSLVANFIHYLDSRLNLLVISKCRANSILLWTNHDCFYVCPTKKHKLLRYYFDSFVELLIKDNVIEHFLEKNNVTISNTLLKDYKANRENILNELNSNKLEMSPFILTS